MSDEKNKDTKAKKQKKQKRVFTIKGPRQIKIARFMLLLFELAMSLGVFALASSLAMWFANDVPIIRVFGWWDWMNLFIILYGSAVLIITVCKFLASVEEVRHSFGSLVKEHEYIQEAIKRGDRAVVNDQGEIIYRVGKDDKPL